VAQLHPALRPPPQELHLVRREMFGPDDRGGAVVFLGPLGVNQPAEDKERIAKWLDH
jgi:hypothetical protein